MREKLFAAKRGGIKKVIVPKDNEKDLKDVPQEVLKDLQIVLVDQVDDVLPQALDATAETIFSGRSSAVPLYTTLRKGANQEDTDATDQADQAEQPAASDGEERI